MKRLAMAAVFFAGLAAAMELSDLSPEARKLFPEEREGIVELPDGATVRGIVVQDTPASVVLKTRKSDTVTMSREYRRADIKSFQYLDIEPAFAAVLLDMELDEENSLPLEDLDRAVALFDEFLAKAAPRAVDRQAVTEKRALLADELEKVRRGWEKIEGAWLAPVQAAVKRFDVYTRRIGELEKRADFKTNPKVSQARDDLVEKRRATARALPGMMQTRVPELVGKRAFDEVVDEMGAFMSFWIKQVVRTEGPAAKVMGEMDFDYIMRLQNQIMDAYRASGIGTTITRMPPQAKDMVYVPGGYFLMGRRDAKPNDPAFPMHFVYVPPFLMDKYEVSNAEYRRFVEHVRATADSSMEHPDAPPLKSHDPDGWTRPELGKDRQPVVGVDWFDAYAYAKWVGKSLPTEAQWEKAARGLDGRLYPWGDDPPEKTAVNFAPGREFLAREIDRQKPPPPPPPPPRFGCGCIAKNEEPPPPPPPTELKAATYDVDKSLPALALELKAGEMFEWSKEYPSPYGVLHMAGNAAEWVLDGYEPAFYGESPVRNPLAAAGPNSPRIHRGGSYLSRNPDDLKTYSRGIATGEKEKSGNDAGGRPMVGFRCVKNLDIAGGN
ncbi:MAG: formylglycine-generating enzyme family protein [Lentisphaerae bacterium]|nr:formylglycine-generating enzyme family protein [Lentisphaerota bacterium]